MAVMEERSPVGWFGAFCVAIVCVTCALVVVIVAAKVMSEKIVPSTYKFVQDSQGRNLR